MAPTLGLLSAPRTPCLSLMLSDSSGRCSLAHTDLTQVVVESGPAPPCHGNASEADVSPVALLGVHRELDRRLDLSLRLRTHFPPSTPGTGLQRSTAGELRDPRLAKMMTIGLFRGFCCPSGTFWCLPLMAEY